MHISIDWIKDFVELPDENPQDLGVKFTMATCEVEGIETTGELLERVKIVEIVSIEDHPDSDHLHLVQFTDGTETKQVVCGAPNVEVGKKVPFAPIGTTFAGGFTLVPKKIRGVMSEGMLCSEVELEIGQDDSGLKIFPEEAPLGSSVGDYLGVKKDILFDIDNKSITHRPDLWGHYGMAREFAAVFNKPLQQPWDKSWEEKIEGYFTDDKAPISISIDTDSANLGYYGLSMDGVQVKPSPQWMQDRLNACGMRPINNIVDISNYVMLELGIPNHIYDRTTIKGESIIVRRAKESLSFTTLDEVPRTMSSQDSLICDSQEPIGIAGIMGGLDSGIKEDTTTLFLEVANWKDSEVRQTATRLGLRTDALQRYEKCLDSQLLKRTLYRLIDLLKESCPEAKVIGSPLVKNLPEYTPLVMEISPEKIRKVLGKEVETSQIVAILEALDFKTELKDDVLTVHVPSYRSTKDIDCEADIIEEIGRVIGYDNITPRSPLNEISAVHLSEAKKKSRQIQDFLVNKGSALEIMTYPMVGKKLLDQAYWTITNESLVLKNAMSPEHDRMRPSMIPSLLEAAALNSKTWSEFRLFELGRSYLENSKTFSEEREQLGLVFYQKKESPFIEMADLLESMMSTLNLPFRMIPGYNPKNPLMDKEWPGRHPHEFYDIQIMGRSCGFITTLHPLVARNFKIKGNLVIAILDISDFKDKVMKDKTKYKPLAKFPSSTFDCTVLVSPKTPVQDVLKALGKVKELDWVKVADVFSLSEDQKAVTVRTSFSDPEKTLGGDVIKQIEDKVVATLDKAGYPLKM